MERPVLTANLLSDGLVGFMATTLISQNDSDSDLLILKGHQCCSFPCDLCVCVLLQSCPEVLQLML